MKEFLLTFTKKHRGFYTLYYYVGSLLLRIIRCFVKTDENLILFVSYGGKQYSDSPLVIYDAMITDPRFCQMQFVWAFREPEKFTVPRGVKIKIDTIQYYITALKARCWITNTGIERGLNMSGKHTFYLNTWHGTPMKFVGMDIQTENTFYKSKTEYKMDIMLAQSEYEIEIMSHAHNIKKEKFRRLGLPRNDILFNKKNDTVEFVRNKLGLPKGKTIVLYAPTFRDYDRNSKGQYSCNIPIDFENWKKQLGEGYVILTRLHYEVAERLKINYDGDFIIDCTDYPDINELMLVSDILISDYSSLMFDYSILGKPILCYAYDMSIYKQNRGLYINPADYLSGGQITEDELLNLLQNIDWNVEKNKSIRFREKYVNYYGQATALVLDEIKKNLGDTHEKETH